MALIYGVYSLDMSNDQFDDLVDSVQQKLRDQCGMAGVPTIKRDAYLNNSPIGACFIVDKGDIVGLGMKNSYFNRFAILLTNNGYELQLDTSDPAIVGIMDLVLDVEAGTIKHKSDPTLTFSFKK